MATFANAADEEARSGLKVNTRPACHISSPNSVAWPFDPNGAIYWKGQYHLMWIQKPGRGWAHASSPDLIHWKMHPKAGLFYFSGNAFVNKDGRAAVVFGGTGSPAISAAVAMDDDLDQWELVSRKNAHEAGDPDQGMYDIWDPFGWHDGENYYAIFGTHPHRSKPATVWKSTNDMKKWNYVGPLLSREMPDVDRYEDISCPDMFRLGDKHMLLCISHVKGARYYLGEFKEGQLVPERHARMNWPGGACFAPETLEDGKGRRIMWAWATDTHRYRPQETAPGWAGILTMPRVLSLAEDQNTVLIRPVEEYEALRSNPRKHRNVKAPAGEDVLLGDISGDCIELKIEAKPGSDEPFGIKVRRSPDGQEETTISYDPKNKRLRIDLIKSSLDETITYPTYVQNWNGRYGTPKQNPNVTAQEAPFKIKAGEPLRLRIFIDRTIMEVFANERLCLTQRIFPTRPDSTGVAVFSADGKAEFNSVEAWDMAPIKMEALE